MTKIGKAMKATYHCGNCKYLVKVGPGGVRWCRSYEREVSPRAGAGCPLHERLDITNKDRLSGPGRRSPARRSERGAAG